MALHVAGSALLSSSSIRLLITMNQTKIRSVHLRPWPCRKELGGVGGGSLPLRRLQSIQFRARPDILLAFLSTTSL